MKSRIFTLLIALFSYLSVQSQAFITEWNTENSTQIIIPTTGTGYNYNVYWEEIGNPLNNGTLTAQNGNATITGLTANTDYSIEISGNFPRFFMNNNATERNKLRKITQWGGIAWTSFEDAFYGAANLDVVAVDKPNLTGVTSLKQMFLSCASLDGSGANWQWDTDNIANMNAVFAGAVVFNQDISSWNVSNATIMAGLFSGATVFNQNIGGWDVGNVTNMSGMFQTARAFNQDISGWNVGKVTNMSSMFSGAIAFNQPLNAWDVSKVTGMQIMFRQASAFNQPLSSWNVGNATSMSRMFESASNFNQDISSWNVGNVTTMAIMFKWASSFNQPLNSWNVGNVTNMSEMFSVARNFNQPLDAWDVSKVTNMNSMFLSLENFNQDISAWDVGNVTNMSFMFYQAESFNQPITAWNVSNVVNMSSMFQNAFSFNQNLKDWDVSSVTNMNNMFTNVGLSPCYYDDMLNNWSALNLQQGVTFEAGNTSYTDASVNARQAIINDFGWDILDKGLNISPYVISVFNNDIEDISCNGLSDGSISISAFGGTAPLTFEWSNAEGYSNVGNDIEDLEAGNYLLTITDANGCSIQETYIVSSPDELEVSTNVSGANISLTVTGGTGVYSYNWSGPDNFTSNDQNIIATVSGDYSVTVTDENGCQTSTAENIIIVSAIVRSENDFRLYPNPANSMVTIETKKSALVKLEFYDLAGKIQYSEMMNGNEKNINISQLSQGTYICNVLDENNLVLKSLRLSVVH